MTHVLRVLGPEDHEQGAALGRLAFGGDPRAPLGDPPPGDRLGVLVGRGRLLASCRVAPYQQWWGGRTVPMGGVASVVVHPDARGQGLAQQVVRASVEAMRERGQVVSALFPSVPSLYRGLGWEVVGAVHRTRLVPELLARAGEPGGVTVRSAGPEDAPVLARLHEQVAATGNGQLSRVGPMFARGALAALEHDVVALAETRRRAGGVRVVRPGARYGPDSALAVDELVAVTAAGQAALLRSLATWSSVVGHVDWRGETDELALQVRGTVPAPRESSPWMLRVVDPVGAVAARGWAEGVLEQVAFALVGAGPPAGWRLEVADGRAALTSCAPDGLPELHERGLALLWSAALGTAAVRRAGLLSAPLPGLDRALAGPRPVLADEF